MNASQMFFTPLTTFAPYVENMSTSFSFDMDMFSNYTAAAMNYANTTAYAMVDSYQTYTVANPEAALFMKALLWANFTFLAVFMAMVMSDSSSTDSQPKLFEPTDSMADEMTTGFTGRGRRRADNSSPKVRQSPRLVEKAQREKESMNDRVFSYLRDGIYTSKDLARLMDVDKRVINAILYKNLREGTVERTLMGERPFWTAR